ncbi:extracellular solute-binding protein [Pelagibacterium sp. H642]|uniref:extracellular solute-binding protein n=1 Tax=Pelagibacterium sp. H642 TaxID=1881069 RepID=UPI0028156E08|nr:extracellular solute-binding protein [Pelagibacterium sp. H642]WMT92726.1 extracellular solute-binding protein [Pelagibacterium sp. H642]
MKMTTLTALSVALTLGAGSAQATDIEFWYGNTGTPEQAILEACEAFNASHEDVNVSCIGQGSYEIGMQKAIAAYRAGNSPVLIQFFDAGTLDLMLSDAVVPVEEIMPEVDWEAYIGGARSFYETSTGSLFSQPYNGSTLIMYANMDLLAEVGVTEIPDTYEGVIEVAQKLRDNGSDCPLVTDGHPWRVLEQFSARHGVPVASRNNGYEGLDAEYVFNEGLVAQHMENLVSWREAGLLRLGQDTRAGDYTSAFNAGECAMMEGSTGSYGAAYAALGDTVQIAYAPIYDGHERYNTLIGGASIWVMKGHSDEEIEAAKTFLDFLREDEQQIAFTRMTGYVPVTNTALDLLEADGRIDEPEFATARVGVESLDMAGNDASRGIRLGFYVQFREIFIEETQRAFNGEQPMQVALDNAKARGDELLRRFEQTYQGVPLP